MVFNAYCGAPIMDCQYVSRNRERERERERKRETYFEILTGLEKQQRVRELLAMEE